MLERQVEEPALEAVEVALEAALDRVLGGGECTGVACERARRVAVDVARELVEHDHARERAVRVGAPVAEPAGQPLGDRRGEALADRGVERRVLAEPLRARRVRRRTEPEIENSARLCRRAHADPLK